MILRIDIKQVYSHCLEPNFYTGWAHQFLHLDQLTSFRLYVGLLAGCVCVLVLLDSKPVKMVFVFAKD